MKCKQLLFSLVFAMSAGAAFAATYDEEINIDDLSENIVLPIDGGSNFLITGSGIQSTYSITITGNSGDISLTLKDVNINSTASTILVNTGSTLNLTIEGENKLESSGGCAIETRGAITIDGSGSLDAKARGWGDAAIGTLNDGPEMPDITINGGTITAQAYSEAPAIGSRAKLVGTITINGGIITATPAHYSSAIGSGYACSGSSELVINGGTIVAKTGPASSGAAIGKGHGNSGISKVTITGGSIKTLNNDGSLNTTNGVQPAPVNAAAEPVAVVLKQCQVPDVTEAQYVVEGKIGDIILGTNYGIKDTKTDETGKLYFYLPESYASTPAEDLETSIDNPNDMFAPIDINEFRALIESAQTAFNAAVVGEQIGEYYQSALDQMEKAINQAITASSGGSAVKKNEVELQEAIAAFDAAKNTEVKDIVEVLADAIASAEAIYTAAAPGGDKPGQYPVNDVNTFKAAIDAAKAGSTRNDLNALTTARKNFLGKIIPVSLTELQATITEAKATIKDKETGYFNGQYPEGAIETFQAAIDAAESIVAFPPTQQEPIDKMNEELKAAMELFKSLEINVNIDDLLALITKAKAYTAAITAEAGSNLATALETFNNVINTADEKANSDEVSQEDINQEIENINNATGIFIETLKGLEGLNNQLLNAAGKYVADSPKEIPEIAELTSKIAEFITQAEAIIASEDMELVTQAKIKEVVNGINTNLTALFELISKDLKAVVEEAEVILANMKDAGTDKYTQEEITAFTKAVNTCKAMLDPQSNKQYDEFKVATENMIVSVNAVASKELNTLVKEVTAKLEKASEGTAIGQFAAGSIKEMKAALEPAQKVLEEPTDSDFAAYYQEAYTALKAAYDTFLSKEVTKVDPKPGDGLSQLEAQGVIIYSNNTTLYISGLEADCTINIYDINGKLIASDNANGDYNKPLTKGNYIVSLQGTIQGSTVVFIK